MDTNFRHKQAEEQISQSSNETSAELEFATPEEALRHDAAHNPPPPEIAERLNKSLADEPKRGTSFWTKLGFRK
jgi:hypothetical protein